MQKKRETVRFKAVRVVREPTVVRFRTKNGESVSFEATKTVARRVIVKFSKAGRPKKK